MLDKQLLEESVAEFCAEKQIQLVDLKVTADQRIVIDLDSFRGVDLDTCAALNQHLQLTFGALLDDYDLEVGSVSLTEPFRIPMQYMKHVGDEVDVLLPDGKKFRALLVEANEEGFMVDVKQKIKVEGKKRPETQVVTMQYLYPEVKQVTYVLKV